MNTVRTVAVVLLLVGVLTLAGAGLPGQTAMANKAPAFSCATFGCDGGPDNCITVTVGYRGYEITLTCYTRLSSSLA